MKHLYVLWSLILPALLCLLIMIGCTATIRPPKETFTGYALQEKIRLRVGLNITDELRKAKWEKALGGGTWVIPIGESLAQNSDTLARHVFTEIVHVSGPPPSQTLSVDAILTPKLAYINRITGATSFGKFIIAIKVEWNLTAPDSKPIWVETVDGEASGTGWTDPEKMLKEALEELLRKSQQAMASSDVIRRFAASGMAADKPSRNPDQERKPGLGSN